MADEFSDHRRQLVIAGGGLGIVFLIALGWGVWRLNVQHVRARFWLEHSHEVMVKLDRVLEDLQAAEAGQRGFLVTGELSFADAYARAASVVPIELATVMALTADNERQHARAFELHQLCSRRLAELADVMRIRRETGFNAASAALAAGPGKRTMDSIRVVIAGMREDETQLLLLRRDQTAEMRSLLYVIVGGLIALAGGLLVLLVSMVLWIRRLQAGLVTICAWTREVRYGEEWVPVEEYLLRRFGLRVSHGLKAEEAQKMLAELGRQPAADPKTDDAKR